MRSQLEAAAAFARDALKAERMSAAGRVNVITVFCAFVLTMGAGVGDLVQVIVRTWNDQYETRLPSTVTMFALFLAASLLCVLILALAPPRVGRGTDDQ